MSKLGSNFDLNDDHAIENNLLKMDIFYKEFNFEDITEVPAYSVSMLICITCKLSMQYRALTIITEACRRYRSTREVRFPISVV